MFTVEATAYDHPELKGPFVRIALKLGNAQVCHWIAQVDPEPYLINPELRNVFVAGRLRKMFGIGPLGRAEM